MNSIEISKKLVKNVGHSVFLGVFAKNKLPTKLPSRRPLILVCNTDVASKPGEHWVALFFCNYSCGEFFDSFGREPDEHFGAYLKKFCDSIIFNDKCIQSVISSFCGHYCIFYCYYRCLDYSMHDIVSCFSSDTALNDAIVHKFVCNF